MHLDGAPDISGGTVEVHQAASAACGFSGLRAGLLVSLVSDCLGTGGSGLRVEVAAPLSHGLEVVVKLVEQRDTCLLYTSPSPRD